MAGETDVLGEYLPPAQFCTLQIPLDQTRVRTRAAAVGSQRLTAWAIALPNSSVTSISSNFQHSTEVTQLVLPYVRLNRRHLYRNQPFHPILRMSNPVPSFTTYSCKVHLFFMLDLDLGDLGIWRFRLQWEIPTEGITCLSFFTHTKYPPISLFLDLIILTIWGEWRSSSLNLLKFLSLLVASSLQSLEPLCWIVGSISWSSLHRR
jgi:hypothetical protein